MVYEYKTPRLYKVSAKDAAEEIERIKGGAESVTPAQIVEASRDEGAVLHSVFEWDDSKAGRLYREQQAGQLIRNIVVRYEDKKQPVRAFVHVESSYEPIKQVLASKVKTERMLDAAIRELRSFRDKYAALKELSDVFKAIDGVLG